ncbi:MAG: DUF11 domain-containing protein [Armatimonadetes bacterium]|nr:DUF11 domain-containing protein [Anaerolineae bacterium]
MRQPMLPTIARLSAAMLVMLFALRLIASTVQAAPPLVNTNADNTLDDAECTLREALLTVNGVPANDDCAAGTNITFTAGVTLISVQTTPLPNLTANGITIDGDTGAGFVQIDGAAVTDTAAENENGLVVQSANNTLRNLVITQFPDNGLVLTGAGAVGNTLVGLYLGTDTTGVPLGNTRSGLLISDGANGNIIGNLPITDFAQRLTLSGNGQHGIELRGIGGANDTRNNNIVGATIGLIPNTLVALPNGGSGIFINNGANNNTIGAAGLGLLERNVISGNTANGVTLNGALTIANQLLDNRIGVDIDNAVLFPNANGVQITNGASNNTVGTGNIIRGNTANGVMLTAGADSNTVNNSIIADNGAQGIMLSGGATNNIVTSNAIETNANSGIELNGAGTSGNNIIQNAVQTNGVHGMVITAAATTNSLTLNSIQFNVINGIVISGDGTNNNQVFTNTISQNTEDGIVVLNNAIDNTLSQNSISNNGQLGIDLNNDGITPNDPNDPDNGPNDLQNFPASLLAIDAGTGTVAGILVGGILDSDVNQPFSVEAFSSANPDGEGQVYQATTMTNNDVQFTIALPNVGLQNITTTATSSVGSTSEFSAVIDPLTLQADFTAVPLLGIAPLTVDFTDETIIINPNGFPITYNWDFGDGTPDSAVLNPTHIFTAPGIYTVTLTVCVSSGGVTLCDVATLVITVEPPSPTPVIITNTPTSTGTASTATITPTFTRTASLTRTPTLTLTPSLTLTPTLTRTATFTRTATQTLTPSLTASRTATLTLTPSLTASRTATLTLTPTLTRTATTPPTSTPIPSQTFTPLPTLTATPRPPTNTPQPPSLTPIPEVTVVKDEVDEDTIVIIVDNDGDPLTGVVIEEVLRPGVIYVSSQPGSPLCQEADGIVTCSVGTLPTGETFQVDITVDSDGVDIVSGQTSVRSNQFNTSIDEAYIVKSLQPGFAAPGDSITYTIRVINPTSRVINDITVRDQMPPEVQINSVTANPGAVTQDGQNITYTLPSLPANGRATITIIGQLLPGNAAPQIANRACLTTATSPRPRCAVAGFVRASILPATGESPLPWILLGSGAVAAATGIMITLRRRTARLA